jgi:hypothetical protein
MPVAIAFAVVNGLLLWLIALARRAWRALPHGARFCSADDHAARQ